AAAAAIASTARRRRQPSSTPLVAAATGGEAGAGVTAPAAGGVVAAAAVAAAAAAATAACLGAASDGRCCEHPGCWRDPVFAGHADSKNRPRFCAVHRMDALVDLSVTRCGDSGGCESTASWGYFGEQGIRCAIHRAPQMVDVKARSCRRRGCSRLPYFAAAVSPAGEGAAWCCLHRADGMLDVKSRRCSAAGCRNLPLDNSGSEDPSSTCRDHRPPSTAASSHAAWSPAAAVDDEDTGAVAENADTGFPSPIADADTAEAATVVASLWADAIGEDWDFGG
ncbi:unnamed protein product, partial [Pylaiella littoralis]